MSIGKPEVDFPGGEPPAELQVTDIWEGNGGTAKAGTRSRSTTSGSPTRRGRNSTPAGIAAIPWSSSSVPVASSPAGTRACKG